MVEVTLLLFAEARELAGKSEGKLVVEAASPPAALMTAILAQFPR